MEFSRFSAWVDEKDLKPYEEFRTQMESPKTEVREFLMALLDIATYLRDPREFAGLFKAFEVPEDNPAQPVAQKRSRKAREWLIVKYFVADKILY